MNENKILSIENLYMKYKKKDNHFALENLNFSVNKGEFHAFIGENGAGKSTTIKIIAGLNNDYEGDVRINGLNIRDSINARNNFMYIPDKTLFPSKVTVFDYLLNVSLLIRNDKEKIKIEINELLSKFEIKELIDKQLNKMSAGQIKKISLIQAILTKVNFLILDEPTNYLDPSSRLLLFNELKRLNKENGTTIFISSHALEEIKSYVDSVTFIKKGKIKWSGKIQGQDLIKKYSETILKGEI